MAVNMNSAVHFTKTGFPDEMMRYRRKKSKMKTKKLQRKRKIKAGHILFMFILIGILFFIVQQTYLFLITWDGLTIHTIRVECSETMVREKVFQLLNRTNFSNFFLLNVKDLQKILKEQLSIEDARIRKSFPATLHVEIMERTPVAYIQMEKIYLIDRKGIRIRQAALNKNRSLPLLIDADLFHHDYDEKLKTAWACMDGITEELKEQISMLDLSREDKIIVQLKDSMTKYFLDHNHFTEKMLYLQDIKAGLSQYGPIEYVDLRFQDRIYLKTQSGTSGSTLPKSLKGVE